MADSSSGTVVPLDGDSAGVIVSFDLVGDRSSDTSAALYGHGKRQGFFANTYHESTIFLRYC